MTTSTASQAPPFDLARQALALVGEYQTPPTPTVYEVWFRYVEGQCEAITEQLDHAINETGGVTSELLEQLHAQFCATNDPANDRVSTQLSRELIKLQGLILAQMNAGSTFDQSINEANQTIGPLDEMSTEEMSPGAIAQSIEQLLASNQVMQTQLTEMGSRLKQSQSQVDMLRQDLMHSQRSVMTDPLTGAGNRRFFDSLMSQSVNTDRPSTGSSMFLMLIDLDDFKGINDTFGHAAGDQVLRFVAAETAKLRPDVSIARYGGDEFAVFMDAIDHEEASTFADQIRRFFSTNSLRLARSKESLGRISLSIGVARLRADDSSATWFERADGLLYRAKESGRNCVMVERAMDA